MADATVPTLSRRLACLFAAIALTAALFHFGAQPLEIELLPAPWDKLAHAGFFSFLTLLLWVAIGTSAPWLAVATALAVGALDEWRQGALPWRDVDALDLIVNFAAVIVTAGIFLAHESHRKSRRA